MMGTTVDMDSLLTDAHFIYKYPNHSGYFPANACMAFLSAGNETERLGCPGMVLHLPLSTSISGDSVAAKWCRVPERVSMSIQQGAVSNTEGSEVSVSWVGNLSQLCTASSPEASLRSEGEKCLALEDLTGVRLRWLIWENATLLFVRILFYF